MPFHRSVFRALAVAAALGLGSAAAEPIHVEYLVDQKPFKSGSTAESILSFELFSDDQCTVSIGSVQHFVGDPAIQYFVDKRHKVKNAPKLPKAVRILATIDGPTATTAPYLMVTGPGVTPVGDACQLQPGDAVAGAGPTGPTGPEGPQGPAGPQGSAGADGAQGPQGDPGPAGADGADGAQGPQGDPGTAALTVEAEVSQFEDSASTTVVLGSVTNRVCFLTQVDAFEVDATGERGSCAVSSDATNWSLTADAGAGNSTVTCSARCLSW